MQAIARRLIGGVLVGLCLFMVGVGTAGAQSFSIINYQVTIDEGDTALFTIYNFGARIATMDDGRTTGGNVTLRFESGNITKLDSRGLEILPDANGDYHVPIIFISRTSRQVYADATVANNTVPGGNAPIRVRIIGLSGFTNSTGFFPGFDKTTHTVFVRDDDNPLFFDQDFIVETEGNILNAQLNLTQPLRTALTVNYAVANMHGFNIFSGGRNNIFPPIEVGFDLNASDTMGSVTFAPGETSRNISIPLAADTSHEGNEAFAIVASATYGGQAVNAYARALVVDNNTPPFLRFAGAPELQSDGRMRYTIVSNGTSRPSGYAISVSVRGGPAIVYVGNLIIPVVDNDLLYSVGPYMEANSTSTSFLVGPSGNSTANITVNLEPDRNARPRYVISTPPPIINTTITPMVTVTNTTTPGNTTPGNMTPDNMTPGNMTPDNMTPDNMTPDNTTPDNITPQMEDLPKERISDALLPYIAIAMTDETAASIASRVSDSFAPSFGTRFNNPHNRFASDPSQHNRPRLSIAGNTLSDFALNFAAQEAAREAAENPWDPPAAFSRRLTPAPTLADVHLAVPLHGDGGEGGGFAMWAQGFIRELDGSHDNVTFMGQIPGWLGGFDKRLGDGLLLGIGISQMVASLDYTTSNASSDNVVGKHDTDFTTYHPYIGWRLGEGSAWLAFGYGEGEVAIDQADKTAKYIGEVVLETISSGFTALLHSRQFAKRLMTLTMDGDIHHTRIEETPTAASRRAFRHTGNKTTANRIRLAFAVNSAMAVGNGDRSSQSLYLAFRHDSGDIINGGGLEIGGSLGLASAGGLRFDLSGRTLLAFDDLPDEWGGRLSIAFVSHADGRGLSLSFAPEWGSPHSRREDLLGDGIPSIFARPSQVATTAPRYYIDVSYGIRLFKRGLLLPFVRGDVGEAEELVYGMQFSRGGLAAGVESDSEEDQLFIRYKREF